MAKLDSATMLKYEQILEKDPNSQVFAPLAEAYREEHNLEKAEKLARKGVQRHPNFPGGLVTLGKILRDQGKKEEALIYLMKVTQIAPDNILAHLISAEIHLQLKQTKEALKSFKMVLLFNPKHEKAQLAVEKLESLTADEYDTEIFSMAQINVATNRKEVTQLTGSLTGPAPLQKKSLERMLSLIDAFIVRNELDKAVQLTEDAQSEFGSSPELEKRLEMLKSRELTDEDVDKEDLAHEEIEPPLLSREEQIRHVKLSKLQSLLRRIEEARSI